MNDRIAKALADARRPRRRMHRTLGTDPQKGLADEQDAAAPDEPFLPEHYNARPWTPLDNSFVFKQAYSLTRNAHARPAHLCHLRDARQLVAGLEVTAGYGAANVVGQLRGQRLARRKVKIAEVVAHFIRQVFSQVSEAPYW